MKIYCKRLAGLSPAQSSEAFLCRGFRMSCPGVGSHDRWEWGEWRRESDGCPAFPWLARAWRLTARQKWPRERFGNENRNSPETCQNDTNPGLFLCSADGLRGICGDSLPCLCPDALFAEKPSCFRKMARQISTRETKKQKSPPGSTRRAYKR